MLRPAARCAVLALALATAAGCQRSTEDNARVEAAAAVADSSWRAADARREAATMASIASLPDSARAQIAWSDRAAPRVESLARAGEGAAALALVERRHAILTRWLGPDHPRTLAAASRLARLAFESGDVTRAHALDRATLDARRRVLGDRHPDVAESLDRLAWDEKQAAHWPEALRLHREALALRRASLGTDAREVAESLTGIANVHRVANRPDSALAAFREAVAIFRRHPDSAEDLAGALTAMAIVHTQAAAWSDAAPPLREAVAIHRAVAAGRTGGLELALGMLGVVERHRGEWAVAESLLAECVALREASRSRALAGEGRAAMFDLGGYWHLAAAQLERGSGEAAWVSVERALSRTLLEACAARGRIDTTGCWRAPLARVQRELREDAAIVGWLEVKRGAGFEEYPFWCYTIRHEGPPRWHRVDAPGRAAAEWPTAGLNRLRRELRGTADWPLRPSGDAEITRLARDVYLERFAPLESDLEGVRELVVVSPDLVRGVPLQALRDTAGRWLADRFAISYAPSALWWALRSGSRAPPPNRLALLVGDPAFGGGAPAPSDSGPGDAARWQRLAASGDEVRELAALLPGARVLLGEDASESRIAGLAAAGALRRFGILHFATHMEVDETWPGRSGLVLAESAAPGRIVGGIDGIVSATEIGSGWDVDAGVVSLAGCRSALGPPTHVEGYLGLNQAFLAAGARCVIVSAWPLEDHAVARLMRSTFRRIAAGAPVPLALRDAQRELRERRSKDGMREYAHPVYWAGVVVLGAPASPRAPF